MSLPASGSPAAARLRIAVLNRTFSAAAGGAERYSMALVEQLAEKHDMHVFAQVIEHQWPGVSYHRVSMPIRRPRWLNQLWFALVTWWATRKGFDVVHSHENTWHGDVQTVHVLPVKHNLFNGRSGWKRVLRWVKVLTSPRLLAYLWLERMRYAALKGRAVVVISETLRSIFAMSYPQAMAMTSIITPGIDLPVMPISPGMRRHARLQLRLPQDQPCILFVGNDFRKKGLQTLLDVMRLLPPEVVLAVVGHSAQLPVFQQLVGQAGLVSRVFFLGALHDVSPAYRAADCLAHPTREDTFAMVVLEAMAHGLPVAVSSAAYCGITGLLEDQHNALILDNPRDVVQVTAALRRLLFDATLQEQLGRTAHAFASRFGWAGIAAQQEHIYYAVAAEKAEINHRQSKRGC